MAEVEPTHPELKGRLDLEHVGVMGHSFALIPRSCSAERVRPSTGLRLLFPRQGLGPISAIPGWPQGGSFASGTGRAVFSGRQSRAIKDLCSALPDRSYRQTRSASEHRWRF
jgi:hypothetical protein